MRLQFFAVALALLAATGQTGFAQTAVSKIVRELESPKPATRLQAVIKLGNLGKGARAAVPDLVAVIEREPDPFIALQAVQALTKIGATRQLQALLQHEAPH